MQVLSVSVCVVLASYGGTMVTMVTSTIFFILLQQISTTPIVRKISDQNQFDTWDQSFPGDFCVLPPKLGYEGTRKFLEECDGLSKL